jgi:hypothetical protein
MNGGNIFFTESDILLAHTLNPFTHIYMFDVGFPYELHVSIAQRFNISIYAAYLISYKPPRSIIGDFGFNVKYIDHLNTSMHGMSIIFQFLLLLKLISPVYNITLGSQEGHMVYFYSRVTPTMLSTIPVPPLLRSRPRNDSSKEPKVVQAEVPQQVKVILYRGDGDEEFLCDPCFLEAINIALFQAADLKKYVLDLSMSQRSMITRAHTLKLKK